MSRTAARFTQADVAPPSLVYFVRIGKHIKIGYTTNLAKRLKAFENSAYDIEVLAAIPGDRALERSLHVWLSEYRIQRELFRREWRVTGFIDSFNLFGFERAMQYLKETSPHALARRKEEDHVNRVIEARKTKAEKDAYFASLVADRKRRIGW